MDLNLITYTAEKKETEETHNLCSNKAHLMIANMPLDNLFEDLAQYRGQADNSAVIWLLLLPYFMTSSPSSFPGIMPEQNTKRISRVNLKKADLPFAGKIRRDLGDNFSKSCPLW